MSDRTPLSVGIVGSGFGGIACAIELLRAGHHDVRLWEKSDELGGVWRDNTYPGAGCDIPSPLYSFSYALNPQWSRRYARQAEIEDYLRTTAERFGVADRVRYGCEVASAAYDEETAQWTVTFTSGATESVDLLVSAVGQLSRPSWPDIPGLETFDGPCFHSARWDHDFDPRGKRVAVIGTGASAVQFVPHLVDAADEVVVVQRSAPYVAPKPDRPYRRWHRQLFERFSAALRIERHGIWSVTELMALGMTDIPLLGRVTELICRLHLRNQVRDRRLRARLTPDYPNGCKRVLFSNDYLPALTRPNVRLVSDTVREVRDGAVVTGPDGETGAHEVDAIVIGTGFAAHEFLVPMTVTGRAGATLAETWAEHGTSAYLGMTVPGFPNLFLAYGPNTNLGSGSITDILEAQARYLRQVADRMVRTAAASVEVRADVAEAYDREMQERLSRSVWTRCRSWYRDATGRVTANWPGTAGQYGRRTRSPDPEAYVWADR